MFLMYRFWLDGNDSIEIVFNQNEWPFFLVLGSNGTLNLTSKMKFVWIKFSFNFWKSTELGACDNDQVKLNFTQNEKL